MVIQEGVKAPDFALSDENGTLRKLSDYAGKYLVLYFYPKDDTPGCTTEACNFRDDIHNYGKAGVVVVGVSPDSVKSHIKFKEKYSLPFNLLADEGHKVCEAYGVWGRKKLMGREYDGVFRTTFLIDPQGLIKRVFENVKPDGHSAEVLAEIA
ncbi:MAG: thioredoxin-dependent thiol peroxidase [Anaerolineaceae bacterium]